jgi:hypothetical protein
MFTAQGAWVELNETDLLLSITTLSQSAIAICSTQLKFPAHNRMRPVCIGGPQQQALRSPSLDVDGETVVERLPLDLALLWWYGRDNAH